MLAAAGKARIWIARKNQKNAIIDVDAGLAALHQLQGLQLVPIYTEVSQQSFLGPVEAAKKGDEAGKASDGTPVAVEAVSNKYSRILLDTSVSRKQLSAAKAALLNGDLKAADKSLRALEQSVLLETVAARMPLVKARENLALAATAATQAKWPEVKAELNAASLALGAYLQSASPSELADVKVLQTQIADYAKQLDRNHDDAFAHANRWWVQVANLTDANE